MIRLFSSNDYLFHYTKVETVFEHILENNSLRFSPLKNTNDPYEFKLKILSIGPLILFETKKETSKRLKLEKKVNSIILNNCKLICFCGNEKNGGSQKARMWSQYADGYRGICLVLSKKAIEDYFKTNFSNFTYYIQNVSYKKIKSADLSYHQFDTNNDTDIYDFIERNKDDLFFLKDLDYKDENEVRILIIDKYNKFNYLPLETILKGLVIGDACPNAYKKIIRQKAKELKIKTMENIYENGENNTRCDLSDLLKDF